jgi:hypothetical protein
MIKYRGHQIIFHQDAGYIVIHDNVVVHAAPTLEEAKEWIRQKLQQLKTSE